MKIQLFRCVGVLAALLMVSGVSQAAIIVTAVETGGNVVFSTPGGTLNTSGLTSFGLETDAALVNPAAGKLVLGGPSGFYTIYSGVTGPADFGSGALATPDSASGGRIFLGPGVVGFTGSSIGTSMMTFNSATFLSLGITPDTYTWTWGGDSITLNAVVPVPAAVWLFGSALLGLGAVRRKKA
jgi:hypothetical protein